MTGRTVEKEERLDYCTEKEVSHKHGYQRYNVTSNTSSRATYKFHCFNKTTIIEGRLCIVVGHE